MTPLLNMTSIGLIFEMFRQRSVPLLAQHDIIGLVFEILRAKIMLKQEQNTRKRPTLSRVYVEKFKKSLKKINFFVKSVDKGEANSVEYECR